jgi:hypothetical protein
MADTSQPTGVDDETLWIWSHTLIASTLGAQLAGASLIAAKMHLCRLPVPTLAKSGALIW